MVAEAASKSGVQASNKGETKWHCKEVEELFEARKHAADQQVRKELSKNLGRP